ncbi:MAG TPA: chemotaxis protein CheW [Polyangia bacterium]
MKLLCFHVAGQDFGVPIGAVKETIGERPLTRLFLVPPFVAGLINLRGEVVAVLDLATLLGLDRTVGSGRRAPKSIVILRASLLAGVRDPRHAANRPAAGLFVDGLDGVRDVADDEVRPPPATLAAEPAGYLDGVAAAAHDDGPPRPLLVLAPERVLGSPHLTPYRREMH